MSTDAERKGWQDNLDYVQAIPALIGDVPKLVQVLANAVETLLRENADLTARHQAVESIPDGVQLAQSLALANRRIEALRRLLLYHNDCASWARGCIDADDKLAKETK